MKASDLYPSRYLKAEDIDGDRMVTLRDVTIEELGPEKEARPIAYFNEITKGLVLNKTNTTIIAKGFGDDTEGWKGRRIILYAVDVPFRNDIVRAIRVRIPTVPPARQQAAQRPPAQPPASRTVQPSARTPPQTGRIPGGDDEPPPLSDDDVPF
jgi:hypothetical protein